MSGEYVSELPEDLREWVERRAEETDRDPTDVLTRAISAYQLLEEEETIETDGESDRSIALPEDSDVVDRLERLEGRVDQRESLDDHLEQLSELEGRVADVEGELDEKIEDVRERVIQIKQETDAKAPADHDHGDIRKQLQRAVRAAEAANTKGERLTERVERVDQGFDNFEEILEYLTDTTSELEEKLDAIAQTVIDLRQSVGELEGTSSARAAAADLKTEANREGITTAKCDGCESKVYIGLLSTPHCPHCGTTFRDVDPADGLFGSDYLRTGNQPALEGGEADTLDSPEDLFEEYDTDEGRP